MRYKVKITEAPEIFKVRVTQPPKAKTGYQVEGSLANDLSAFGGGNLKLTEPKAVSRTTITKVPREEANLEAEGGETVLTFDPSGYPLFYDIKGPRHSANGVPLNLPDDSFIFSDTKSMMIKDPAILKMFNKAPKKGGYTPADLSKQFLSINKYRMTMQNADADKIQIKTAELMIKKALIKLGALALAQESKKGFPQGIPAVAKQYMEANNLSEQDILPDTPEQESPAQAGQAIDMGQAMAEGAPQQAMEANEPPTMPDGSPVAMPQEMPEQGMPPQPGMRFGGRLLRRAQEGLQAALGKVTERVNAALEAGQPLEEILVGLLRNDVTPEDLMGVLANLAIPEPKAKQLINQAITDYQTQAAQQQQAVQQQQGPPMGQPGMQAPPQGQPSPEQMMAMAQQMPQEQMQQAPMAMYGMEMGGYGMPFYNNPNEMAYGGALRKAGNGEVVKGKSGNVTANKADKKTFESHKGTATKTASGKQAKYLLTSNAQREYDPKKEFWYGKTPPKNTNNKGYDAAGVQSLCDRLMKGATVDDLVAGGFGTKEGLTSLLAHCIPKANEKFSEKEEAIYLDETGTPTTTTNTTAETTEEECVCTDPMTKQETVFPKNADGTCEPCTSYQMEETLKPMDTLGKQYLPEDNLKLIAALGSRYTNTAPVEEKVAGVRTNAWGTDYMGQAELMKGMTQGTINAIQKTAANNPLGAIAAMMAAGRGAQGNVIDLATQTNASNANIATGLNQKNTAYQDDQLKREAAAGSKYNAENATWNSNKAQDFTNWLATAADVNAQREINSRMADAVNEATGMKWDYKTGRRINTNNKKITPELSEPDIKQKVADYTKLGYSRGEALKAIGLDMQAQRLNKGKFGGDVYKKGGFIYADMMYPFIL